MTDTLDRDVQALKEWLGSAWRCLAQPSITRYEQRELRNYMREAEAALRTGLQKIEARDKARKEGYGEYSFAQLPDFRLLKVER